MALGALLVALVRGREGGGESQPLAAVIRFALPFPADTRPLEGAQFAASPDGTTIALAARASDGRSRLWIRRLQAIDWQELPRTNGASYPFWSPDSQHIGFFAERRLQRIDVSNGVAQTVCEAPDGHGGTWGIDNQIIFAPSTTQPLQRVSASGGAPQPITRLDGTNAEMAHLWPRFLRDGVHLVYFANAADPKNRGWYLADPSPTTRAIHGAGSAMLVARRVVAAVPAGDLLLFSRNGTLMAQRFDVTRRELDENITSIAGADEVGGPVVYGPPFSASSTVLVYRNAGPRSNRLMWFDRQGKMMGEAGMPGEYQTPAISPDGRRVAVARSDERVDTTDIWIIDLDRDTTTRVTFNPDPDTAPIWSPDARRVAFASRRSGGVQLMATSANGGGTEDVIATWPSMLQPTDWSMDGRVLLFTTRNPKTGLDVWAIPIDGDRKAWPLLQTPFDESDARFSPDGRWLAYVSNESGMEQIYVRSFPEPESRFQISVNGGSHPHWRSDGRQLLFVAPDSVLMAVDVDRGATLTAGTPQQLMHLPDITDFAVRPGGEQFLIPMPNDQHSRPELQVIVNWMNELRVRR